MNTLGITLHNEWPQHKSFGSPGYSVTDVIEHHRNQLIAYFNENKDRVTEYILLYYTLLSYIYIF